MSLAITWNGREYDVDPEEFSTREIGLITERTGLAYPNLILGVVSGEGDPIRALFWLVDQRTDPAVKYADYDGPPAKVWKSMLPRFTELVADLGKATGSATGQLDAAGSGTSPNGSDTPLTNSTV